MGEYKVLWQLETTIRREGRVSQQSAARPGFDGLHTPAFTIFDL